MANSIARLKTEDVKLDTIVPPKTNRSYSFDILRLLACFTVVLCHTAGSPIIAGYVEPGAWDFNFCIILDAFTRWNIAAFVMLSGFFLIDPRKEMSLKSLFSKYILRVVGALIIWSGIYAATLHISIYPFGSQEGHFWYLPMIIGVYLSIPVLRLIALNKKITEYFLIVWFFFLLWQFIGNFVTMPCLTYATVFADFVGYALFAYYLKSTFSHPINETKAHKFAVVIYVLGLLGLATTIITGLITGGENHWWDFTAPNNIATVTAAFVFAIRHPLNLTGKKAQFVETCAKCSFGVYLIHIWILIQIFRRLHRIIPQTVPLVLICWIASVVGGLVITYLLRKIPGLKRFMV